MKNRMEYVDFQILRLNFKKIAFSTFEVKSKNSFHTHFVYYVYLKNVKQKQLTITNGYESKYAKFSLKKNKRLAIFEKKNRKYKKKKN